MVSMVLVWVVLVGVVIWVTSRLAGPGRAGTDTGKNRPEEILKVRYDRGELDRETYQRMLEDLRMGSAR
jgi:putative membrane protein